MINAAAAIRSVFPARSRSPQPQRQLKWKRKHRKGTETKSQAGFQLHPIPYYACMNVNKNTLNEQTHK
jgi:hypothetical protein